MTWKLFRSFRQRQTRTSACQASHFANFAVCLQFYPFSHCFLTQRPALAKWPGLVILTRIDQIDGRHLHSFTAYAIAPGYFLALLGFLHHRATLRGRHLFDLATHTHWLAARSDLGGLFLEPVQNRQENRGCSGPQGELISLVPSLAKTQKKPQLRRPKTA